jgi:hypothetical protein
MGTELKIWQVSGNDVKEIARTKPQERELEDWIVKSPDILGEPLLIIGRQEGLLGVGRFDLLAIDGDGQLVILELKRDKSPREAIAQALDYGSWLDSAALSEIRGIAEKYLNGSLEMAFQQQFGDDLPEIDPHNHRLLLVAAELDVGAERIINYLREHYHVDINALFFKYCILDSDEKVLLRSLLIPEGAITIRNPYRRSDDEIMQVAENRHVKELVDVCRTLGPDDLATEEGTRGFGGASFRYWIRDFGGRSRVSFVIVVGDNKFDTPDRELDVLVYLDKVAAKSGLPEKQIKEALASRQLRLFDGPRESSRIRLQSKSEANALMELLKAWLDMPTAGASTQQVLNPSAPPGKI